jgi:arsenite-transporting ATPase
MQEYAQVAAILERKKQSEEDQILAELQDIKQRINTSSGILTDRQKTAFFFVVTPEEMIILDTLKAAKLFARYQVPISGYIVNRVIPPALAEQNIPAYLHNRIQMQGKFLKQIDETFGADVLTTVPEFERDITGLEMIGKVADALFGEDVPAGGEA